jgi:23S rRNA (cytidine2498-2'-O)-methyltransferase
LGLEWAEAERRYGRMIFRCQSGFELLLEKELRVHGFSPAEMGEGWLHGGAADGSGRTPPELCFAHAVLLDPVEITGDSVNALAGAIAEKFFESARTERFEGAWPLIFEAAGGLDGLGRRMSGVEKAFDELLKKKMGRVAKLATPEKPRGPAKARGLFVFFADFKRVFVARECVFGGQRRMADDEFAPSRSYLKIEEAYVLLGREPDVEETVADLGAAPGGWSYSAAKRRAHVVAVDNGPLKGGALGHALIDHRKEDAFRFEPGQGERFDWLFCDLVEEPHHVMRNLIEPWITRGWCRRFVVILKFGRVDPIALLQEITAPGSVLATHTTNLRIRHLYHDREEFTIVGEVKA